MIQIKHAVRLLSLDQLRKLEEWLHELIRRGEEDARAEQPSARKQAVTERTLETKTYQLESIRCGKESCKCACGKLHGPYWYNCTGVTDKVTSQYIGKKLPKDVEKKLKTRSEK